MTAMAMASSAYLIPAMPLAALLVAILLRLLTPMLCQAIRQTEALPPLLENPQGQPL